MRNRILLIDFDRRALEEARTLFEQAGFDVCGAGTGYEATALLEQHAFDVVLLEPMLPGLDGFKLCQSIKQRQFPGRAPHVIVASRIYRGPRFRAMSRDAGADAHLERPQQDSILVSTACRLIAARPSGAASRAGHAGAEATAEAHPGAEHRLPGDDQQSPRVSRALKAQRPTLAPLAPESAAELEHAAIGAAPARATDGGEVGRTDDRAVGRSTAANERSALSRPASSQPGEIDRALALTLGPSTAGPRAVAASASGCGRRGLGAGRSTDFIDDEFVAEAVAVLDTIVMEHEPVSLQSDWSPAPPSRGPAPLPPDEQTAAAPPLAGEIVLEARNPTDLPGELASALDHLELKDERSACPPNERRRPEDGEPTQSAARGDGTAARQSGVVEVVAFEILPEEQSKLALSPGAAGAPWPASAEAAEQAPPFVGASREELEREVDNLFDSFSGADELSGRTQPDFITDEPPDIPAAPPTGPAASGPARDERVQVPQHLRGMDAGTAELLSSLEELEKSLPQAPALPADSGWAGASTGVGESTSELMREIAGGAPRRMTGPRSPSAEQSLEEVISLVRRTHPPLGPAQHPTPLREPAASDQDEPAPVLDRPGWRLLDMPAPKHSADEEVDPGAGAARETGPVVAPWRVLVGVTALCLVGAGGWWIFRGADQSVSSRPAPMVTKRAAAPESLAAEGRTVAPAEPLLTAPNQWPSRPASTRRAAAGAPGSALTGSVAPVLPRAVPPPTESRASEPAPGEPVELRANAAPAPLVEAVIQTGQAAVSPPLGVNVVQSSPNVGEVAAEAEGAPIVRAGELDAPLDLLEAPQPELPPEAQEASVTGRVFLSVLVAADGTVAEARVMVEPGYGLGQAARQAARNWRYTPPKHNGAAARVWKTEVIEFRSPTP